MKVIDRDRYPRGEALHSCSESSAAEPGEGQVGNVAFTLHWPPRLIARRRAVGTDGYPVPQGASRERRGVRLPAP